MAPRAHGRGVRGRVRGNLPTRKKATKGEKKPNEGGKEEARGQKKEKPMLGMKKKVNPKKGVTQIGD